VCARVCACVCGCVYVYIVCASAYTNTYIHKHPDRTFVLLSGTMLIYTRIHMYSCIHMRIHMYLCTYMRIHMYVYTCVSFTDRTHISFSGTMHLQDSINTCVYTYIYRDSENTRLYYSQVICMLCVRIHIHIYINFETEHIFLPLVQCARRNI